MKDSIVKSNCKYSWKLYEATLQKLKELYPFIVLKSIGKSVMGKDIYAVTLGNGEKKLLYNGTHHANEWICTPLLLKFIESYCYAYKNERCIYGENIKKLWNKVSIHILPLINPDGMELVCGSMDKSCEEYKNARKIAAKFPDIPFPHGWKANIEGTDLNLNYPAGWSMAKKIKYDMGIQCSAPKNYVGTAPLSAPESRALYNYTVNGAFCMTLSYHTQGRVIYWKYLDYLPDNSQEIAKALAKASSYTLDVTPAESGYAGYKDWFISSYNKPGYTVEAGEGENPLDISQLDRIYSDNEGLLITAAVFA